MVLINTYNVHIINRELILCCLNAKNEREFLRILTLYLLEWVR